MPNHLLKLRTIVQVCAITIFSTLLSFTPSQAQGITDYTGVWIPTDKEAIVPEMIVKRSAVDELILFFYTTCTTDPSGKCLWGEAIGFPKSINDPLADPVENTDEVSGAFAPFPDKVVFSLSHTAKEVLRLDMTIYAKGAETRKIYVFKPKPRRTPPVAESPVLREDRPIREIVMEPEVVNKPELIMKPEITRKPEIIRKPEVLIPANKLTGSIKGKAKGLISQCSKYTVIILKDGEQKNQFLDPDPENCSYQLDGLAPGKYLISVLINYPHEDKYSISPGQIDNIVYVKAGQTTEFNFTISQRDVPNNNQISGALSNTRSCGFYQVSFYNPATKVSKSAKFDNSTCRYIVEDLPAGTYRVSLGFSGKADGVVNAQPYPTTIYIGKGDKKVINFSLK